MIITISVYVQYWCSFDINREPLALLNRTICKLNSSFFDTLERRKEGRT